MLNKVDIDTITIVLLDSVIEDIGNDECEEEMFWKIIEQNFNTIRKRIKDEVYDEYGCYQSNKKQIEHKNL